MTVQEFWDSGVSFLNLSAVYYVTQILKCVQISSIVFAFVYFLRRTRLKNRLFLKSKMWILFHPVLISGKIKFFYENTIGILLFSWWAEICKTCIWVNWLYISGIFVYAARMFYKKRKLKKMVAGMERRILEDTSVYVAKMPATPSTIGIFRPKIVMPEVMLKEYSPKELHTILLHEKTHIQLGHLLFYFLWDILRALLWLNPLLTIGTKFFREDMEEVCDWVTIQKSGGKAYAYGQLLLKSMRVLQAENENFNMFAAFAGDKEYQDIRQRVTMIALYRPYKQAAAAGAWIGAMLCTIAAVIWIQNISYGRYHTDDGMLAYGFNGSDVTFFGNDDALHQMITYDGDYVYVDREAFENYLQEHNASGDIFIVFGGFYKLPGIGGVGCSCNYEFGSKEQIVQIPYESPMDSWRVKLLKLL